MGDVMRSAMIQVEWLLANDWIFGGLLAVVSIAVMWYAVRIERGRKAGEDE